MGGTHPFDRLHRENKVVIHLFVIHGMFGDESPHLDSIPNESGESYVEYGLLGGFR